jgi:outer membrane biogenesis lipoprotein LolB
VTARAPAAPHLSRRRIPPRLLLGAWLSLTSACLFVRTSLGPVPASVSSLEGYASWRLVREGASSRARFSFLLVLPARGLIEVTDPLNRTVSRLFLEGETAYLVLPGKKAFWQASRGDVMTKLLGFDLSPEELAALLCGRAEGLTGWSLETDDRARVIGGRRGELTFSVGQFFDGGRQPQTIAMANGAARGSLRIIRLQFNQPPRPDSFRLDFLADERYRAVGWPEIEAWLRNED